MSNLSVRVFGRNIKATIKMIDKTDYIFYQEYPAMTVLIGFLVIVFAVNYFRK